MARRRLKKKPESAKSESSRHASIAAGRAYFIAYQMKIALPEKLRKI